MVYVFDKTGLIAQFDKWQSSKALPPHTIILETGVQWNNWYLNQRFGALSNAMPINLSDVPKEVKTACLIMGISI